MSVADEQHEQRALAQVRDRALAEREARKAKLKREEQEYRNSPEGKAAKSAAYRASWTPERRAAAAERARQRWAKSPNGWSSAEQRRQDRKAAEEAAYWQAVERQTQLDELL